MQGGDSRREARRIWAQSVTILRGERAAVASLVNISPHGLQIETDWRLRVGDKIDIVLSKHTTVSGNVIWAKGGNAGLWCAHRIPQRELAGGSEGAPKTSASLGRRLIAICKQRVFPSVDV